MENLLKNRNKLIVIILIIAVIAVGIVGARAYTSKLQYEINELNAKLSESNYQIATLEVKIKTATNVANLEGRALELGLIHPGFENIIYLNNSGEEVQDFATALRSNAYN